MAPWVFLLGCSAALFLLAGKGSLANLSSSASSSSPSSMPTAMISSGEGATSVTLEGTTIPGRYTESVDAFFGIPYGEEPRRWKDPVMKRWNGTTGVVNVSDPNFLPCLQFDPFHRTNVIGENDCLKLNVWKPSNASSSSSLPVIVFIHGGGLKLGGISTGHTSLGVYYQGQNLVEDTIVVTLQYRLGPLGFLGSEMLRNRSAINSTGNYGILDQRLALQWVHENIEAFGGDPEHVFLFGQSAGAQSVSAHLMSEASWPYFSSAGMQSGAFIPYEFPPLTVTGMTFDIAADALSCTTVDCLLDIPDALLINVIMNLSLFWTPAIDGVVLTRSISDIIRTPGAVVDVPMMIGNNEGDGGLVAYFGGFQKDAPTTEANLSSMKCGLGPNLHTPVTVATRGGTGNTTMSLADTFAYSKLPAITPPTNISTMVTPEYWTGVAITTATYWECPLFAAADSFSANNSMYVYEYRAQPKYTSFGIVDEKDGGPLGGGIIRGSGGAEHGAEVELIFGSFKIDDASNEKTNMTANFNEEQVSTKRMETLATTMSQAWINFAKTHNPGFQWQPWTKDEPSRAIFDYHTRATAVQNENPNHALMQCAVIDLINTCDVPEWVQEQTIFLIRASHE